MPNLAGQSNIDEARLCCGNSERRATVIASDKFSPNERGGYPFGQCHGVSFVNPRQDHRGIRGKIAMGGIARRLDRNAAQIEPRWQLPVRHEILDGSQHDPSKVGEYISHVRIPGAGVLWRSGDVG